jgi:hypothetical protein
MKRPDFETIFGGIALDAKGAAERLLNLFVDQFDGYLSRYYAKMKYDSNRDTFYFFDEEMNLHGRADLLMRLERDAGGSWSCDLNLGFYPATVTPMIFSDAREGSITTVLTSIDSGITRFLEEEEVARIPFVTFLIRIAIAIGARWFLGGIDFDHWKSLSNSQIMDRENLPRGTYVVCWENDTLDELELCSGLGTEGEEVKRSVLGYNFVTFFPLP